MDSQLSRSLAHIGGRTLLQSAPRRCASYAAGACARPLASQVSMGTATSDALARMGGPSFTGRIYASALRASAHRRLMEVRWGERFGCLELALPSGHVPRQGVLVGGMHAPYRCRRALRCSAAIGTLTLGQQRFGAAAQNSDRPISLCHVGRLGSGTQRARAQLQKLVQGQRHVAAEAWHCHVAEVVRTSQSPQTLRSPRDLCSSLQCHVGAGGAGTPRSWSGSLAAAGLCSAGSACKEAGVG